MNNRKVVIKLSSGLLVSNHKLQRDWLKSLANFVSGLQNEGYQIWLITSGARALAKQTGRNPTNHIDAMQGQKQMVELYQEAFASYGLKTKELLLTKDDFEHRKNYLKIRTQLDNAAAQKLIPLINDLPDKAVSSRQFSDNDEIAGLIASMVDAERLILASTVAGVLKPDGTRVNHIAFGDKTWTEYVSKKTSEHGTGGMLLKCQAAEHSAHRGVEAVICSGQNLEMLRSAVHGKQVGTIFAADRRISARKRWILDKKDFASGAVSVDDGLARVIKNGQSASLLTVGITSVGGNFLENDIVAIKHGQDTLGYGEVSMDAKSASRAITGQKSKLLIHYDRYARIKI